MPDPNHSPCLASSSTPKEINSLCTEVSRQCKPWTLSGFLQDPSKEPEIEKGFLLSHIQEDSSGIIKTISIKSLISTHDQSPQQLSLYMALSAKQRYGIAASVAWSVLHLSGSPWLGDRWDEEQAIILLERSSTGREILSRYPCASYLFPTSTNPASLEQTPRDNFTHLIPNKTVFALGILLIELCINKPFGETQGIRVSGTNTSPTVLLGVYTTALGRLDEVRRQAGDSYGNAVERCVKCVFRGSEKNREFDLPGFRREFYEVVVAPVQAVYLMMPGSDISK